jgi:pimeloyl-ACP methyl ester carboxylesterase
MNRSKAVTLASVPVALGLAWHQHRRTVRAVGDHPSIAPSLPGEYRQMSTSWGSITYRWVPGDPDRPALVLVHGWGRTADSTWWPVIAACDRTMVVVDLPGHGRSRLDQPFTFELAAEVVHRAIEDSGVERPVLVAHSMGGPVVFTALRGSDPDRFSGLVVLASSAYWVKPRLRAILAMAPYVMAPGSPVLIHKEHAELRRSADLAPHVAWAYSLRPLRQLLREAAAALRRFDARGWTDLFLPPTIWVVADQDQVVAPIHQRASARHFGAESVELAVEHSMLLRARAEILEVLERAGT